MQNQSVSIMWYGFTWNVSLSMFGPVIYVIHDTVKSPQKATHLLQMSCVIGALMFRQRIRSYYVSYYGCIFLFSIKHEWHVWLPDRISHYWIHSVSLNVSRNDVCCLKSNVLYLMFPHLSKCACMLIVSFATCWETLTALSSCSSTKPRSRQDDFSLFKKSWWKCFYLSAQTGWPYIFVSIYHHSETFGPVRTEFLISDAW